VKCVAIHDYKPFAGDTRCIITTHKKPIHIFSINPFKKRTSSSAVKTKEKLDVRSATSARRLRQTSTTVGRPMSSTDQPFDAFNLLGIDRRTTDGTQELSYGYLLVASKSGGGKASLEKCKWIVLSV
jgi:hypothetical protein